MNYREYLASIGRKGGKKSRRKLSKKDARSMAARRWERVNAAQAGAAGSAGKRHERANKKRSGGCMKESDYSMGKRCSICGARLWNKIKVRTCQKCRHDQRLAKFGDAAGSSGSSKQHDQTNIAFQTEASDSPND